MFKFTQIKLPAVLLALSFVLTACGGGNDTAGNMSSNTSGSYSAKSSVSFLPTTATPPSAQEIAIQKEGARLNSEELAQIAKTGVRPTPFNGPLLSGAESSSEPSGKNNSSLDQSPRARMNFSPSGSSPPASPVYRFYNTKTAAHFYTINTSERDYVIANFPFLSYEGIAFYASTTNVGGLSPVHRFYNTQTGVHFYTISEAERANVAANLPYFTYEGIAYYASTVAGTGQTTLYRFYFATKGFHFYTNSIAERDNIIATLPSYSYEGIGYYVLNSDWQPLTPAVGAAQGVYQGSFASPAFPNGKFSELVLDDDSYYTLYGNADASGDLVVTGLLQGSGAALSDGTFSSSNLNNYVSDGSVLSGSLAANYQASTAFNATITSSGTVNFAGVAPAAGSTSYDYNTPAVLSMINGAWSGSNLFGGTEAFTVDTTGALSGTSGSGCAYTGSISPRASGKSVFNVNLTLATSTACGTSSGLSLNGVGVTKLLTNGINRQFIITATSIDRSKGTVLIGTR